MSVLLILSLLLLPSQSYAQATFVVLHIGDDYHRGAVTDPYTDAGAPDNGSSTGSTISTPNLDTMAAAGTRLDGFRTYSICYQTRATAYGLGKMNRTLAGWTKNEDTLITEVAVNAHSHNLFRQAAAAGFTNIAFFGKWHLGVDWNQDPSRHGTMMQAMGITHAEAVMTWNPQHWIPTTAKPTDWDTDAGHNHWQATNLAGETEIITEYSNKYIFDKAAAYITAQTTGSHLVIIASSAPHFPWDITKDLDPNSSALDEAGAYDDAVEYVDLRIGDISALLTYSRDTFITMSDNGIPTNAEILKPGHFTECDSSAGAKGTPFPCGTYVHFIARGVGITAGAVMTKLYHVSDLTPTIIDLMGTKFSNTEGKSFADCLTETNGWTAGNCWGHNVILTSEWKPNGGNTDGTLDRMPLETDAAGLWDSFELGAEVPDYAVSGGARVNLHRVYNAAAGLSNFCETFYPVDDSNTLGRYIESGGTILANTCDEGPSAGLIDSGDFTIAATQPQLDALSIGQTEMARTFQNDGARTAAFSGVSF